jgi:polar amino acid transport system substrate-binding protein
VIKIGVDASYAPNEFLAGDGKTVQAWTSDVFNAGRCQVRGQDRVASGRLRQHHQRRQWQEVRHGDFVFTINPERMKQVNMVSYFNAGTQWATAKGNPKGVDPTMPAEEQCRPEQHSPRDR